VLGLLLRNLLGRRLRGVGKGLGFHAAAASVTRTIALDDWLGGRHHRCAGRRRHPLEDRRGRSRRLGCLGGGRGSRRLRFGGWRGLVLDRAGLARCGSGFLLGGRLGGDWRLGRRRRDGRCDARDLGADRREDGLSVPAGVHDRLVRLRRRLGLAGRADDAVPERCAGQR
jgi:hypothetical protein